jgi:hypothetical protein
MNGHFTVFALTTQYTVAFGTRDLDGGTGCPQLAAIPGAPTLKEALIAALVEGKDFNDYVAGDPDVWQETQATPLTREDWTLITSVLDGCLRPCEAGEA